MTRSRNRRLRLIPSHLPLIRDKLAEYERVALKEEMAAHSQYERSMEAAWNFADNLAVAQLWWISRDMTALAEDTVQAGDFPKSELRHRVYDCQLDKDGETEDAWLCIPSERLRAKYERLVADEESTQSDYDKLYEELSAYSDTLTTEQLMDWFIDLNDPETISGWTERIEAHNAYIDVMEPNNAVLRNPLDVDSTFHIRIYDYFIDFHEDREIVDDLEFTPSDVDADDWTEDIKRCLEENGWRLDSKIGTDSDDSDLLVFDCVKA